MELFTNLSFLSVNTELHFLPSSLQLYPCASTYHGSQIPENREDTLIFVESERPLYALIHINLIFFELKKRFQKLYKITWRNAAAIQEPPFPPPAILLMSAVGLASWTCFEKCLKRGIRQTLSPVFIPACN